MRGRSLRFALSVADIHWAVGRPLSAREEQFYEIISMVFLINGRPTLLENLFPADRSSPAVLPGKSISTSSGEKLEIKGVVSAKSHRVPLDSDNDSQLH